MATSHGETPSLHTGTQLANALSEERSPVTADVRRVAQTLESAISRTQNGLHALVVPHTEDIGRQISSAEALHEKIAATEVKLDAIEDNFDATQPKNGPQVSRFLNVTSARQSSQDGTLFASLILEALKSLKASTEKLRAVEDAIWSGRSAAPTVIKDLDSIAVVDEAYSRGEAAQKLRARKEQLRSLLKEQLAAGWAAAFDIEETSPDGRLIKVADKIVLPPPEASRVSLAADGTPATDQTYGLAQLCEALQDVGILQQLLSQLQAKMLRDLVDPILSSRSLVPEGYRAGDRKLRFASELGASLTDLVSGIRDLFDFTKAAFSKSQGLGVVTSFLSSFRIALYEQVLATLVIPSMPRNLAELPPWMEEVTRCASWEQESAGNSSTLVLHRFLAEQLGRDWLACHWAAGLLDTRSLVYEGWRSWESRVEQRNSDVGATSKADVDGTEEGWGFDDDLHHVDPAPVRSQPNEDGDGWDFDDLAPATPASAPAPLAKPKPAREAKRLGRKLASKHAPAVPSQDTSIDFSDSQVAMQPSGAPDVPHVVHEGRGSASPQPEAVAPSSTVRVSVAVDTVVAFLSSKLLELQEAETLRFPVELQDTLRSGLQSQLTDILDFLRATLPVAHRHTLSSKPINWIQLGNDFRYMASQMLLCETGAKWPMRAEAAAGYVSAANVAYQSFQLHEQRRIEVIFLGTNLFVDLSEDHIYQQAESAVAEVIHAVTDTAAQLRQLADDRLYHDILGAVVNGISVLAINAVLAIEDITEVESQRIESLTRELETLQKLFRSDTLQMSSVATYAPQWLKMCYLTEVLRSNLAEISQLYDNGSLVDFTPGELSKLIRALFADSQKRAALLEKINQ